jgi:ABC-type amino acid transport substrate-binding protein
VAGIFGVLALLLLLLPAAPASAECRASDAEVDVAIGVRDAPPFISEDAIRGRRGLIMDLWGSVERELQAKGVIGRTELVDCPLGVQVQALASGALDIVISPLTITSERMLVFDFSHQYLNSGITVAQRSSGAIDFAHAAATLWDTMTQKGVPRAILLFLALNFVLAAILARLMRQTEEYEAIAQEPMPVRYYRFGMEAVVRTIGLYGLGDSFRSTAAKSLEVVMAIIGAVLSATIFGVLTAAFIGSIGHSREVRMEDLPGHRVATLAQSTSQHFFEEIARGAHAGGGAPGPGAARAAGPGAQAPARRTRIAGIAAPPAVAPGNAPPAPAPAPGVPQAVPAEALCVPAEAAADGTRCVTTTSWQDAMLMLARGEVDLVLGDWAQLSYLARLPAFAGQVDVQSETFRLEPYGWGFTASRPELRAAVDRALMDRIRQPAWRYLVQEYLGDGTISPH